MTGKKIIIFLLVVIAAVSGWYGYKRYGQYMSVSIVAVDPQVTVYMGGGGNSTVYVSEDGTKALVIDTKMGSAAKKLREYVTAKDITIVNTHFHRDHVGGDGLYPEAKIIAGAYTKEQWADGAKNNRYPDETVKTGEDKIVQIGSETVHIRNMGRAHTWDDLVIYFENRGILVTGDLVFEGKHPVLSARSGTNVANWINVLGDLSNYKIDKLVPGHGDIGDRNELLSMKDYFVSCGDAIGSVAKKKALREKYKNYIKIPGLSGLGKTIAFIEKERQ